MEKGTIILLMAHVLQHHFMGGKGNTVQIRFGWYLSAKDVIFAEKR